MRLLSKKKFNLFLQTDLTKMGTQKKVTSVSGTSAKTTTRPSTPTFVPTPESKGKATKLRVIAAILWFFAIAAQVVAISLLFKQPVSMLWIIVCIAIDLALVLIGSVLWKKSNRLDPASEKQKFKFMMQNQLGTVVAVIAFLPLVVFVLTNKNIDQKQKGILGAVAGVALIIAAIVGVDFNPPSVEQYTEEINRVEWLNNGNNHVYWTKSGSVYHLYDDCSYINTSKTSEIFQGTVQDAHELKNINRLCTLCDKRAVQDHNLNEADYTSTLEVPEQDLPAEDLPIEEETHTHAE